MQVKALYILLALASFFSAFPQEKVLPIIKTSDKITIDGMLTESAWLLNPKASGFWQNFPYDTSMAKTKTEVMVCYSDECIYIGAICYDSLPGKYVIQSLKRDFSYPVSDAFVVTIDPFSDKQNGFSFGVNPYGVQREGLVQSGGGQGVTTNWDNKWFSEVKRMDNKWVVEMAIPFKSIRYKSDLNEWRINFSRNDLKRNENSSWIKVPRQYNISTLAFTAPLKWDAPPVKTGKNISLIPYVIGRVSKDHVARTPEKYEGNLGLDAKITFGSMNLDLTINPDFSQVEVDRQITNLTRFSLFSPSNGSFLLRIVTCLIVLGFGRSGHFFHAELVWIMVM